MCVFGEMYEKRFLWGVEGVREEAVALFEGGGVWPRVFGEWGREEEW